MDFAFNAAPESMKDLTNPFKIGCFKRGNWLPFFQEMGLLCTFVLCLIK